jgi:hypothetical protein
MLPFDFSIELLQPMLKLEKKLADERVVKVRPCYVKAWVGRGLKPDWTCPAKRTPETRMPVEKPQQEPFHTWFQNRQQRQGVQVAKGGVSGRFEGRTRVRGKRKRLAKEPGKRGWTPREWGRSLPDLDKSCRKGATRAARRQEKRKKKIQSRKQKQRAKEAAKEAGEREERDQAALEIAEVDKRQRLQVSLPTKAKVVTPASVGLLSTSREGRRDGGDSTHQAPSSGADAEEDVVGVASSTSELPCREATRGTKRKRSEDPVTMQWGDLHKVHHVARLGIDGHANCWTALSSVSVSCHRVMYEQI